MFERLKHFSVNDLKETYHWFLEENRKFISKIDAQGTNLLRWIGSLQIDVKLKAALKNFYEFSAWVAAKAGPVLVRIGKIMIFALRKFSELFPSLTAGITIGIFLTVFSSAIPAIGPVISMFFRKIAIPVFGVIGLVKDISGLFARFLTAGDITKAKAFFAQMGINT